MLNRQPSARHLYSTSSTACVCGAQLQSHHSFSPPSITSTYFAFSIPNQSGGRSSGSRMVHLGEFLYHKITFQNNNQDRMFENLQRSFSSGPGTSAEPVVSLTGRDRLTLFTDKALTQLQPYAASAARGNDVAIANVVFNHPGTCNLMVGNLWGFAQGNLWNEFKPDIKHLLRSRFLLMQ